MTSVVVVGSVAEDHVVNLAESLRVGGHHQACDAGVRIGGGAANTAMALARGGAEALLVSSLGRDEAGERLLQILREEGVQVEHVDRGSQTTRSLVMLDATGERTIVNLSRASVPIPRDLHRIAADLCYVRSADPQLDPLLPLIMQQMMLVLHMPPTALPGRPAHMLIASRADLGEAFLQDPWSHGLEYAGEQLQWLVITAGAEGAEAWSAHAHLAQPAEQVTPVDTTGAGDVFIAGLMHALGSGLDMARALRVGCCWGALSTRWSGTRPVENLPAPLSLCRMSRLCPGPNGESDTN